MKLKTKKNKKEAKKTVETECFFHDDKGFSTLRKVRVTYKNKKPVSFEYI